jgi:hypothetical protein
MTSHIIWEIEWFILCHDRCVAYGLNPRPQTKLARHLCILPKEHLSTLWQLEHFSCIDPVRFGRTPCILPPKICHLGELTMGLELSSQPFVCYAGNIESELGSSLLRDHSDGMVYTSEAGADPCILCQWKSGTIHTLGNTSFRKFSTFLCPPLRDWWPHLSLQY